jgi:hypothetical protein
MHRTAPGGTGSFTAATGTITAKSNKDDGTMTAVTINHHT